MVQRRSAMLARRAVGRTRQLVVLAIAVSAIAGLVALERRTVDPSLLNAATRATSPEFRRDAKASTWFCPGVIGNDDQVSGLLVISNFAEVPVGGTITRFMVDGVAQHAAGDLGGAAQAFEMALRANSVLRCRHVQRSKLTHWLA